MSGEFFFLFYFQYHIFYAFRDLSIDKMWKEGHFGGRLESFMRRLEGKTVVKRSSYIKDYVEMIN